MNLINIAKHLLYLTKREFSDDDSKTGADEIAASQQLFEVLKSFKDSYFNELDVYETLDFDDEYDEITEEEESIDEEDESIDDMDDFDENQQMHIYNQFTLEEMEDIIEWVDQHPNYKFTTIKHRFRKVKLPNYISRFREYIKENGTRLEKLDKIKQFMSDEFYIKRTIEKEAVHDTDLERFAIQKARELNWDNFQKEYISPRTLSFTGERTTEVAVKKKNNVTHSYTMQPITSTDGQLLDKFLLILQETENEFDSQLLVFPEGSTGHIQPQDLSLFRSWRYFHKKIEHYVHINRTEMNLNDRQYFINMHSIIHNQLSAPPFKNLIKSGFIQAKILNEIVGEINKPKDVCFKFYDLYCLAIRCEKRTLLTCAWCKRHLCYYHLIEDLHLHL
ncbi:unnamed protein product [Rotaria magnacalcarata]|uniref:Transposase n=1 Tax=Rotaria magnacalcarata TaxID=392030 RepID=A0A818WLV9_9BILA|nr:unnamed protein product [Rotaria magnacalcarata]